MDAGVKSRSLDVHNVLLCMCVCGYVCSTSVASVNIYTVYIYLILHYNNSDYTAFWGTYTNCKSSAVPQ